MFSIFRSFARSPIAKIMIAFLIVGLTAYALPNLFSGAKPRGLISAGDRYIMPADVERRVNLYIQNVQQAGEEIPSRQQIAQSGILTALLNQMTGDTAQLAYMDGIGVKATKFALADEIKDAPIFQDGLTGQFDTEAYESYAQRQSGSVSRFEDELRDSITVDYMSTAIGSGIDTPDAIARTWMLAQSEQRQISYTRIPVDSIDTSAEATEDELRAFYADNAEIFRQPERRSVSLLQVSTMDYLDRVDVPDSDIKAFYDQNIKQYSAPETRTIVQFASPDRAVIQEAVDRIGAGEDRNVVSADLTAAVTTLNVTPEDITSDLYNRVVFASDQDVPFGPIQVNEEWLAGIVIEVQPGAARPFELVSEDIQGQLATRLAEREFTDAQETFYDLVGGGFSLEEISQEIGVPLLSFVEIDRRGLTEGGHRPITLLQLQEAVPTLFDLSFEGEQSDVLEQGEDALFILRLDKIVAEHTPPFEEVEELVKVANETRLVDTRLDTKANDLKARAEQAGLEAASQEAGLEYQAVLTPITRRSFPNGVSRSMAIQVFSASEGDLVIVPEPTGERVLVSVDAVQNLSDEELQLVMSSGKGAMEESIVQDMNAAFLEAVYQQSGVQQNATSINDFVSSMAGE